MSKMKDEIREIVYKNIDGRIETDKKIGEFVYPTRAMKEAIVYNIKKHISQNYIPKERVLTREKISFIISVLLSPNSKTINNINIPKVLTVKMFADALLNAGSIEKVGVEDIEKIADDIFRDYYVPLYSKDKPLREMTSYETGVYRTTQMVVSMTIQAIYNKLKEEE